MLKIFGFIAFVLTGLGLILTSGISDMSLINIGFILIVGLFFAISVIEQYYELKD